MSYEMNDLLTLMLDENSSDMHLEVGQPPMLRVDGYLVAVKGEKLKPEDTEALGQAIASDAEFEEVKTKGSVDFAFSFMERSRFRASVYKTQGRYGIVLRAIPSVIRPLEEIGLPGTVKNLLTRPRGLILVTGPTGSGKTTTLAAMVDWINKNREAHVITIEDPIEYQFTHEKSLITQREVGVDTPNFEDAIRAGLRQDPDVIMVGEMRDLETIKAAIMAAETGHLVFGTLHTTGAARTVDRIVHAFPSDARDEIRMEVASSIAGVISQALLPKVGGGRIAAFEIMIRTDSISTLIRDNKTFRINSEIQTGANLGMITLDAHLQSLYTRGLIPAVEAVHAAQYPEDMRRFVEDANVVAAAEPA